MDDDDHDFEQMQVVYQRVKHTWAHQDDPTKREMLVQIREIYHSLSPGERGFMTDIHHLEREIEQDLEGPTNQ
jgi:hypothetical protein